ncbi:MAG TPA: aminotransferase class III-fold pyridoxal phosphate-dependent enzyme [Pyrinomonadaceae bacterium]|jgi:acetylornithine/succinyldiaminopimelate/putrescine aminotransferase/acyl-CoA synthetase (AMP-forming)/AMP-acid ligase II/predicted amino acid dehydrogenase/acyl carrier protein
MSVTSLIQLLRERAQTTPDRRAYIFLTGGLETESLTFSQLNQRALAIAARLQQLQANGERALLLYPPGTEYIAAFYGCLAAGAVAIPAYPPRMNRNLQRLEAILEDASPKVVLTTETVFRQMRRLFDESPHLAQLNWVVTDNIQATEADAWVDPRVKAETLAFLQYTSASTSKPKGVMVSHGNILHNQILMKEAVQHDSEVVSISWLPLFHDMGLISVVLASLYNGFPCHLMSPVDFLKRPLVWLEAMTRYKGTFSGAPNFGFQLCVERISQQEKETLDLSRWRVAYNGSEPVRAETLNSFSKAFASCGFRPEAMFTCYGLAEHTLFASGCFYKGSQTFSRSSLEKHRPLAGRNGQSAQLVSCGTPLLDARVTIADTRTRRRCSDGEIGEIWLASPSVAQGYWNQPEISERDFRARLLDGDGLYLRTGDLGFLHDGELYITGRVKDLIIIRGRNIIPQDIEQTVEKCDPSIRPAFVAAVSVDAGGSEKLVVVAEVRREVRRSVDTAALIERIRSAVAAEYAVEVSAVVLLRPNSLPKTSSGKTQRAKVRAGYIASELDVLVEWRDESVFGGSEKSQRAARGWSVKSLENWLVEHIAVRAKLSPERIDLDMAILSYGLDSLAAAELVFEVEETFKVELNLDRLFEGEPTVRQIAQRILSEAQATQRPRPGKESVRSVVEINDKQVRPGNNGSKPLASSPPNPVSEPATVAPTVVASTVPVQAYSAYTRPEQAAVHTNGNKPRRTHPFRTSVNPELGRVLAQMAMDKTFVRGEGSWLWDEKERRYLDFLAQYGALPFGFNPPRIWAALSKVQESGEPSFIQPSFLNAAGELAERLLAVAPPGMAYVTFGNSGAEAVEAAIKLCRSTTGRHNILSASNSFHGKTLGALSATDKEKYQKPFGAPVEGFDYVPYGDIEALRRALSTGRYAGFLVEPVQGEGGIVEPPAGYLRFARKACREAGTLFVADEIQTGLGRTGAMFVCCELGITPDIMTVAKALGGGLVPIGACLSTAAAYNEEFALKHTSTFAGNTLACRAALATLDLLEENDRALINHVAENGARLKEGLLDLKRRFPNLIGEVRGRGYLLGLRFCLDRYSVEDGLLGYLGETEEFTILIASHLLHVEGVRVGCTLNQGGVLRIEPPLTATWEECLVLLQALERVLLLIERRQVAVLTAHISGLSLPATSEPEEPLVEMIEPKPPAVSRRGARQEGDGRFAFLVHPLAWKDYTDLDGTLSVLSEEQLATLSTAIADNFEPMVIGETRVVGNNGKAAYGEFIMVPRRAEELQVMSHEEAVAEIYQAVLVGKKRGAQIVGLGAYTSVVTRGGLSLKGLGLPALTTGNSYTAIASRQSVRLAAAERGWTLPSRTVAVVGAGGAIGQALSILLARDAGRLVLLGNPAHAEESYQRLLQVAGRIVWSMDKLRRGAPIPQGSVASWAEELDFELPPKPDRAGLIRLGEELIARTGSVVVSVDAASILPQVDMVVCCTSTTERIVLDECLRPNAVVCDVSRPSNVSDEVLERRPDVMILDGGVVRMPGDASLGFNASLAKGRAYACMAETMMLAMEQRYQDMSLGFDLPLEQVLEMERLADELGFQVVLDQKERSSKREDTVVLSDNLAKVADFGSVSV